MVRYSLYNFGMDTREIFQHWLDGREVAIAKLIGFQLISCEAGHALFEMEAGPQHWNPMGTLHGGILCDLADAAMGTAMATTLKEHESFTTLELKINFLKPVWRGTLRAAGKVIKRGRTIAMMECDVIDEQGSLVARSGCTCMVLRGEQAMNR